MSDVCFKASLQNTLNPEVGTFDNVDNKKGTFTLEDGEYYLTNNTDTSYRVYYPTKNINSVGFTKVEFDINYHNNNSPFNQWCLVFNGDDDNYWHGFGVYQNTLQFVNQGDEHKIVTSPSTWLHVKCIFNYDSNQNNVHIYIDDVEVKNFTISNNFDIKYIDILGNSIGYVAGAKIKNITIYNSEKNYLNIVGLTSLWLKIKSLFATKSDLSNYYIKSEVDNLLSNIGSGTEGGDDAQNVLKSWPDGPEAHNAMWGGRDITAAFDSGEFSEHVADGTFKDIFPGDYITKKVTIGGNIYPVTWVVADCDYWINKGEDQSNAITAHHVVIVPQASIFDTNMNPTSTTEGGYAGSYMYKNIIPGCAAGIVSAFGSEHILTFRDHLSHDLNTSAVSSGITTYTGAPEWWGEWVSVQCNLMSEAMVYNGPHCASSATDNMMATRQMSAFRLSERLINYNHPWSWWLRDVVSSVRFAAASGYGFAGVSSATNLLGVRPFALLR